MGSVLTEKLGQLAPAAHSAGPNENLILTWLSVLSYVLFSKTFLRPY